VLNRYSDEKVQAPKILVPRFYSIRSLASECSVILSALAFAGNQDEESARKAFECGVARTGLSPLTMMAPGQITLADFDRAIEKAKKSSTSVKNMILGASSLCISADHRIEAHEAELFRAICLAFDVHIPLYS
jgi:hypothetical protein